MTGKGDDLLTFTRPRLRAAIGSTPVTVSRSNSEGVMDEFNQRLAKADAVNAIIVAEVDALTEACQKSTTCGMHLHKQYHFLKLNLS